MLKQLIAASTTTGAHRSRRSTRSASESGEPDGYRREILGILALTISTLLALALVSFNPALPDGRPASDWIGPVGGFVADTLFFSFGVASFGMAAVAIAASLALFFGREILSRAVSWIGLAILLVSVTAMADLAASEAEVFGHRAGGLLGQLVTSGLVALFGIVGASIISAGGAAIGLVLSAEVSLERASRRIGDWLVRRWARVADGWTQRRGARALRRRARRMRSGEANDGERDPEDGEHAEGNADPVVADDLDEIIHRRPRQSLFARLRALLPGRRRPTVEYVSHEGAESGELAAEREAEIVRVSRPVDEHADPEWVGSLDELEQLSLTGAVRGAASQERDASGAAEEGDDGETEPATRTEPHGAPTPNEGRAADTPDDEAGAAESSTDASRGSGPTIVEPEALKRRKRADELNIPRQAKLRIDGHTPWEYPQLSFLNYEEPTGDSVDKEHLRSQATVLEETLAEFGVKGTVTGICPGPVITMFEFEPEPGTKLSKISGLSNDLAMALRARGVRVIAPLPGRGCVGIEVPNDDRETVWLKEIIASDEFMGSKSKLALGLGKDISGEPVIADLAKMPHLLIAGTTGSGKSVSVNAMLTSLLYNASPDDVRLLLVDPKQLEFAVYRDVPHLLLPVVTEPAKAANALNWAVAEMERRYGLLAELRVRHISSYNEKLRRMQKEYADRPPRGEDEEPDELERILTSTDEDGMVEHGHLPYIVIVIDEFADLMMVAKKEVETAVARLAQKARAAGIHLILATQRPSVDVITGLIKANFPTRMSCRLLSGTDSRTVLDSTGAEALLGRGDMLFRPPGQSELRRVHGAYVDESEIERIVNALRAQRSPEYDESILEERDESGQLVSEIEEEVDELYDDAVRCVCEAGYASISMVQRKLRIGYNRAARIVDAMEREGIIGPAQGGSSRRDVLVKKDYEP